jgi:serine/threonine protein kinase
MQELVGKTLGQYQIISELGRGGMAVVYKAYQPALQRYVALKVLPPQLGLDPDFVRRFQHEAIAAARLKHPNIVTIHDVSSVDGVNFIVMELVEGESLAAVIRRSGAMQPERVSSIVAQVASALDYAHQQGFIHRDIKPSNIMLGADDHITLMDFGIAKAVSGTRLTQTGTLIGTPEYMSPEQVRGLPVDHRADIYSLGVVVYEMQAGQVPFSGDTASVLYKQAHELPPPIRTRAIHVPPHVASAIDRALAKDPNQRFATAGAFAQALAARDFAPQMAPVAAQESVPARLATLPYQPAVPPVTPAPPPVSVPARRSAWVMWAFGGAAALVLLCIVVIGVVMVASSLSKSPTPTSALALAQGPTATSQVVAAAPPVATRTVSPATATVVAASSTPTNTPVPVKPSDTPAPTRTFTPAPTRTSTPTPTPSCPPVTGPFAAIWQSAQAKLGCATTDAHTVDMAEEMFQKGRMYWRKDNDLYVLALYSGGSWGSYLGDWKEGDPDFSCGAPASPPTPIRGFGRAWCKYPEIRNGVGDATTQELGYNSTVQDFAHGMIFRASNGQALVLYSGDGWETR